MDSIIHRVNILFLTACSFGITVQSYACLLSEKTRWLVPGYVCGERLLYCLGYRRIILYHIGSFCILAWVYITVGFCNMKPCMFEKYSNFCMKKMKAIPVRTNPTNLFYQMNKSSSVKVKELVNGLSFSVQTCCLLWSFPRSKEDGCGRFDLSTS